MDEVQNKTNKKTFLVVLAHPDDESFGMGGTLALYASQGVDVHLLCATRGEVGTVDPEFMEGYDSIAELREQELRCAAENLGLASVTFLGYRDSGMQGSPDNEHPEALASQPEEQVAAQVVHYIRKFRPQIVLTFDPVGGYHHPDHIAIHKATVKAVHAAGDAEQFPDGQPGFQPDKLFYTVFDRRVLRAVIWGMKMIGKNPRKLGRNQDIDLEMLAGDEDYPVHARINYKAVRDKKRAAEACHASQLEFGIGNWMMRLYFWLAGGTDSFMQAYPQIEKRRVVRDLFTA